MSGRGLVGAVDAVAGRPEGTPLQNPRQVGSLSSRGHLNRYGSGRIIRGQLVNYDWGGLGEELLDFAVAGDEADDVIAGSQNKISLVGFCC
jgi:hypothetical protein